MALVSTRKPLPDGTGPADPARLYIADMQAKIHEALGPLLPSNSYALLDFPDIKNVGDSAIWVGEIEYLRRHTGRPPAYVATLSNLRPEELERHVPDGPILLRGGGNFGDIWSGHQQFRERVLQTWPERPVIQLAQSIHFEEQGKLAIAAKVIDAHRDFTLLVRDEPSLAIATRNFNCRTLLCPDMAFAIGPIEATAAPQFDVLAMLRRDKERAASGEAAVPAGIPVEDWITEAPGPVRRARMVGALSALGSLDVMAMRRAAYESVAGQRLGRGVRQLSRARALVTDRLHVHIISILLGKPHAVLDNSYSKIDRFRQAFPEPPGLTQTVRSAAEAFAWAQERARGAQM